MLSYILSWCRLEPTCAMPRDTPPIRKDWGTLGKFLEEKGLEAEQRIGLNFGRSECDVNNSTPVIAQPCIPSTGARTWRLRRSIICTVYKKSKTRKAKIRPPPEVRSQVGGLSSAH